MQKPLATEHAPYFQKYIDLAGTGDFFDLFYQNTADTIHFFEGIHAEKHNYRYAENKWTVKDVFLHIIDTERVFAYRMLVGIRGDDKTTLQSMDENAYAQNANATGRSMESLLAEFKAVRAATEILLTSANEEQLQFLAKGASHVISARALAYITLGHAKHHTNVVAERYL